MLEDKTKLLIIDNDESNLLETSNELRSLGFEVITSTASKKALTLVGDMRPSLIILGTLDDETSLFEILREVKRNEANKNIPVVLMTGHDEADKRQKALVAGVDDFLNKPPDQAELTARVNSLLKVKEYNVRMNSFHETLDSEVQQRTMELTKALERIKATSLDTVYRLSRAAEYKDEDTGAHVQRMSHYSSAIARGMGMDVNFVENILWAAPMHDIGKIGIPDRILQKPGKLNPDEWEIMKQHSVIGAEILKDANSDFMIMGTDIALSHHEKWDGSGYPKGKSKADIPLAGRIVALADVFDALTSKRPYKEAFPLEKAMDIIKEGHGVHFDPDVVDAFFTIQDEIVSEHNWWIFMSSDSLTDDTPLFDFLDKENL